MRDQYPFMLTSTYTFSQFSLVSTGYTGSSSALAQTEWSLSLGNWSSDEEKFLRHKNLKIGMN